MGNLWEISREATGMAGFSRDLGYDLESTLTEKGYKVDINQTPLDKHTGFIITWIYHRKHSGEIMISKSRGKGGNSLTIDRFWGIRPAQVLTGRVTSSPDELRTAAQIYDEVTYLLESKFGNPISEHSGRSIYRASLEQEVVA